MPDPGGNFVVKLTANDVQLQAAFVRAGTAAEQSSSRIRQAFASVDQGFSSFAGKLAGAFGVSLGVGAAVSAIETIISKAAEGERSVNQLNAVLKATGGAAGISARGLEEVAKQVEGKSIFDDNQIRAAETALLRFRTVQGDVFKDAIRLAPDVASALGVDLPSAATALGRALTDPETGMRALRAAGLGLSDQQKDLAARFIESGNRAAAQKIVLDELTRSVGGASEADNKGAYGATKRLGRAWDDLLKALGKPLLSGTVPDYYTQRFSQLTQQIQTADLSLEGFLNRLAHPIDTARALGVLPFGGNPTAAGKIGGQLTPKQQAEELQAVFDGDRQTRLQQQNADYNAEQTSIKQRAAASAVFFGGELAKQKAFLDQLQAANDFAYSHSTISTQQFYDEQERIAEASHKAAVAEIGKRQQAELALANAPSTNAADRAAALLRVESLANDAGRLTLDLQTKRLKLTGDEIDATQKYADQLADVHAKLLEIEGDTAAASALRFKTQNRPFRDKLTAEGDTAGLADVNALEQATNAQSALTVAARQFGRTIDELDIKQQHLDNLRADGSITELDYLARRSAANREFIPTLQKEAEAYEAIARSLKDGSPAQADAILQAQKLRAQIEGLAVSTDLVARKFTSVFSDAFTSTFDKIIAGGTSARDIIKGLEKDLVSGLGHIASQNLSEQLFGKGGPLGGIGESLARLFGFSSKGKGGDVGALALTGSATALTGSAAALTAAAGVLSLSAGASSLGTAASSVFQSSGGLFDIFSGFLPSFAVGTGFVPRDMVAKIHKGEAIIPANQNYGGSGPISVTNHFAFAGPVDRRTQDQIAVKVAAGIQRGVRKAG